MTEERIRYKYKVIKRQSRRSAILNGNSKYSRQYIKGENTYAHGGTMGLMVFKNKNDAEVWRNAFNTYGPYDSIIHDFIVIRVLPIGRGRSVVEITSDVTTEGLERFYLTKNSHWARTTAPGNTMAYPGVFVVD